MNFKIIIKTVIIQQLLINSIRFRKNERRDEFKLMRRKKLIFVVKFNGILKFKNLTNVKKKLTKKRNENIFPRRTIKKLKFCDNKTKYDQINELKATK